MAIVLDASTQRKQDVVDGGGASYHLTEGQAFLLLLMLVTTLPIPHLLAESRVNNTGLADHSFYSSQTQ